MDAGKLAPKKRKKCSKRSRSSASRSEDEISRKKDHDLKKSKVSSKTDQLGLLGAIKKCSDVEEERRSRELTRKIERKKKRKKSKLKKRRSESERSSSFSSSESEKRKKKKRKDKKKKKKEKGGRINYLNSQSQRNLGESISDEGQEKMNIQPGPAVPVDSTKEPKRRVMAPMTKEEYDKQQSRVRRVFDPDTGRERLIKGEGEIVEEAVSYERHKAINKLKKS